MNNCATRSSACAEPRRLQILVGSLLTGLMLAFFATTAAATSRSQHAPAANHYGVLVMAHGGGEAWNNEVSRTLEKTRSEFPVEMAFGMADPASLQKAVEQLEARGVQRIGVVRLFISGESWYERTEQILGIKPGAPMRPAAHHEEPMQGVASAHGKSKGHSMEFWQVSSNAEFAMSTQGLAEAPEMGAVLAQRARTLSTDPAHEDVLILAHGPADDAENQRWIKEIDHRADAVRQALPFRRVHVTTLREDWPAKREPVEQHIRQFVERASAEGGTAIVIPYRVQGFGPYAKVLKGLDYRANDLGLAPSPQIDEWVRRQAEELEVGPFHQSQQQPARGNTEVAPAAHAH